MKSLAFIFLSIFGLSTMCYSLEQQRIKKPMDSVSPIFLERHSGRAYDKDRPVSLDQLRIIAEAGHFSPSCYNDQPWYFIICDRATQPVAYQKAFNSLVEFNQGWAKEAPVLVVILANTRFHRDQKPNRWGPYDTGAAALGMMLQTSMMGLMAHQMAGFDENKIRQDFSLPENINPMSVMTIGYEKKGEEAPKKERRPLDANFFLGSWGNPLSNNK